MYKLFRVIFLDACYPGRLREVPQSAVQYVLVEGVCGLGGWLFAVRMSRDGQGQPDTG